jgi:hypothetical protein
MPLITLHRRPSPKAPEFEPDPILVNTDCIVSVKGLLIRAGAERQLFSVVTMKDDSSAFIVVETVPYIAGLIEDART